MVKSNFAHCFSQGVITNASRLQCFLREGVPKPGTRLLVLDQTCVVPTLDAAGWKKEHRHHLQTLPETCRRPWEEQPGLAASLLLPVCTSFPSPCKLINPLRLTSL